MGKNLLTIILTQQQQRVDNIALIALLECVIFFTLPFYDFIILEDRKHVFFVRFIIIFGVLFLKKLEVAHSRCLHS